MPRDNDPSHTFPVYDRPRQPTPDAPGSQGPGGNSSLPVPGDAMREYQRSREPQKPAGERCPPTPDMPQGPAWVPPKT
jgi:hypothetical protein